MRRSAPAILALLLLLLSVPAVAAADRGGDDETRVRMKCAGGTAELRLRTRDEDAAAAIEVELRIDTRRPEAWRIVVLHERRLVYQGSRRATRSVRYRRLVPDWPGRETVAVRATTRTGRACRLAAAI
jgi:hypothetical protein